MELKVISDKIIALNNENKEYEVTLRRYRRRYPESLRNYRLVSLLSTGSSQDWNPLRILQNVYDGYGNSIRKVMGNKDREKGLLGVVADIVKG